MEPNPAAAPLRSLACPLCGGPNGCEPARKGAFEGAPCWCTTVEFSTALLARVPEEKRRAACICRRCATETEEPTQ